MGNRESDSPSIERVSRPLRGRWRAREGKETTELTSPPSLLPSCYFVRGPWPQMRISHTRSRYIYDLYYVREAISKPLYDWLLKEGYADAK